MGVMLTSDCSWSTNIEIITKKARERANMLRRVFCNWHLDLQIKVTVYKTVVRPLLEYACEVWHTTSAQAEKIESTQLSVAKMILQCPLRAPTPAMLQELNLQPLETRRDIARLKWHNKIYNMSANRTPKRMLDCKWRRSGSGSAAHMWMDRTKKVWASIPDCNTSELLPLNAQLFLAAISEPILLKDQQKLRTDMQNGYNTTLSHFKHIPPPKSGFPKYLSGPFCNGTKYMARFRCGSHSLCEDTGRQANNFSRLNVAEKAVCQQCPFCKGGIVESAEHALIHCPAYTSLRSKLWSHICAKSTPTIYANFLLLPCFDKCTRLLMGDIEGFDIIEKVKHFFVQLVNERGRRLNSD